MEKERKEMVDSSLLKMLQLVNDYKSGVLSASASSSSSSASDNGRRNSNNLLIDEAERILRDCMVSLSNSNHIGDLLSPNTKSLTSDAESLDSSVALFILNLSSVISFNGKRNISKQFLIDGLFNKLSSLPLSIAIPASILLLDLVISDSVSADSKIAASLFDFLQTNLNKTQSSKNAETKILSLLKAKHSLFHAASQLQQFPSKAAVAIKIDNITDDMDKFDEKSLPALLGVLPKPDKMFEYPVTIPFIRSYSELLKGNAKDSYLILSKISESSDTNVRNVALNNMAIVQSREGKHAVAQLLLSKALDNNIDTAPFEIVFNLAVESMNQKKFDVSLNLLRYASITSISSPPSLWLKIVECVTKARQSKFVPELDANDGISAVNISLKTLDIWKANQLISDAYYEATQTKALLCQAWLALDVGYFNLAISSSIKVIEIINANSSKQNENILSGAPSLVLAHTYAAEGFAKSSRLREAIEHSKKASDIAKGLPSHGRSNSNTVTTTAASVSVTNAKNKKNKNQPAPAAPTISSSPNDSSVKISQASVTFAKSFTSSNSSILAEIQTNYIE